MALDTRRITWFALAALVLGLLGGAELARREYGGLERLIALLDPIGKIWINAVRMTIIPLVSSLLIVALASSDGARSMGRLGGAAIAFFVAVLSVVALLVAILGPVLLGGLVIDAESAALLRDTASSTAQRTVAGVQGAGGIADRFIELIPPNPIRAAADAALLPLVVFSIIFGAALSRVTPDLRDTAVRGLRAVSEAMLLIIRWVFIAAPIGVLALAVVVGARLGFQAIDAAGRYVAAFAALMVVVMLLVYVVVFLFGKVSIKSFATAVAPAQVIALGSRSSSACLPTLIDAARDQLKLPPPIVSFVLPMAVAIFRISVPVSYVLGAIFLGKLYDVPIAAGAIASLAVLSILMSFSVPPVPSGSLFIMAPAFVELGLPVEGVGILIALDVIPDLFKTATITTAHMASAVVVARVST